MVLCQCGLPNEAGSDGRVADKSVPDDPADAEASPDSFTDLEHGRKAKKDETTK